MAVLRCSWLMAAVCLLTSIECSRDLTLLHGATQNAFSLAEGNSFLQRSYHRRKDKLQHPTIQECSGQLPNPFNDIEASLLGYQAFSHDTVIENFHRNARAQNHHRAPCNAISRVVRDGLKWNLWGMDFSDVVRTRRSQLHNITITNTLDPDIKEIMLFYYGACKSCWPLIELDYLNRFHPVKSIVLMSQQHKDFKKFSQDGFLRFVDLGLNIDQLRAAANNALQQGASDDDGLTASRRVFLPDLEPLLSNTHILKLASAYMGSDIKLTGYKIFRLTSKVTEEDYISGYWHNDGCGSRLKLFVYLDDIDEQSGCVTEIVPGSQNTVFYEYGAQGGIRFVNEYVKNHYAIERMTGQRGGGFIFDTNTVHRGNIEGKHLGRDAVIIDISSITKVDNGIPGGGTPCPEPGTYNVEHVTFGFHQAIDSLSGSS